MLFRSDQEYPDLSGDLGCAEAIKETLQSKWGRKNPRTLADLEDVFSTNGLYFPKSTITGNLSRMNKRGDIRRVKRGDLWGYIAK